MVKVLAISLGVLWLVLLVVLQLMLTECFLRSAAEKYLPDVIEGADVTFGHIKASAIKSFPNLRVEIDSVCISYSHDRWAAYDSLPGIQNPLSQAGRGEVKDTLASFSKLSVSVSYIALLKGTISISDISLSDSRIFVRQFDSTQSNLNVFKFMNAAPDTLAVQPEPEGEAPDIVFHDVALKGRTLAVYTNTADTLFAALGSRNIEIGGNIAIRKPFRAKLTAQMDSVFVSGRTATDTIAAGLNHLGIERSRGYHHLTADGRTFVAMGGSGRMMLPVNLDGRFRFPGGSPDKLKIRDLRLKLASFSLTGESDLEFLGDSVAIKAKAAVDSCNVAKILKDFAPLIGPESKKLYSDADVSLTASCDGILSFEPFRLPPLTANLKIPDSKIRHADVPETGRIAADVELVSDKNGFATATARDLHLSFAGVKLDGKGTAKDLLGSDPLLDLDATASADLQKLSVFLPDDATAEGRVDAKLKGKAKLSEFGPGRFAGANLDGFLVSDGLTYRDSSVVAYLGKTDVQLTKKPRAGKDDVMLIVEGQVDSVYAALGPVTRIRGKALDIAISDVDASVNAQRLSLIGEDSLFLALKNSRNYVKASLTEAQDSKISSLTVSSDNEGLFLRNGKQMLGLRSAQLTTSGTRSFEKGARTRSRRKHVLDSLQKIWPGTPRDSLFAKMMRQRGDARRGRGAGRGEGRRGGRMEQDLPDYMQDKSFRTQDISFRLDESLAKYFREWNLEGFVNVERGFAATPEFPLRTRISTLQGHFNNNEIVVDSIGVKSGQSDLSAHATLSGLRRALLGRGTVRLDANVYSRSLDANEIIAAMTAGQAYAQEHAGETVAAEGEISESNAGTLETIEDSTARMPLIVVPANLNVSIGLRGDTIKYSTLLIDSFRSQILMKERCLQVSGTSATSNMGNISLEGFYSTKSRKDLSVGFDLNLRDITGEKIITLIPQVDTLLPLLKSFRGKLDCEFAATSDLDTNMNFVRESINGLMQINGHNLTIEQDKTIRKITRLLLFKNKKTGFIDEMSVRGVIGDAQLEIFPFDLTVDRYKLALGGLQNFDGTFNYHISVLKSPIPWKFGINLKGNFDKWKWRFGGAKYKKIDTPVYTRQLDTARVNLRNAIRNIFEKGVSLALEQSRAEVSNIRSDSAVKEADAVQAADTLSAQELRQMDSLMVDQTSLLVKETVAAPDSLNLNLPKKR